VISLVRRRARTGPALGLALALLVWPTLAAAQAPARRIGWLAVLPPGAGGPSPFVDAFRQGLREHGWVEGQNLVVVRRYADGRPERFPDLARELVALGVEVIVVPGPWGIRGAQAATRAVPIVMVASSADPVADGLVASLARPGGNITGLTYTPTPETFGKLLELAKEAVPQATRVGLLLDLDEASFGPVYGRALEHAARQLQIDLLPRVPALDLAALEAGLAVLARQGAGAVYVAMGGPAYVHRARVAELATRHRLPTIALFRELPEAGGLMSYGPSLADLYRRAAAYVDRLLRGGRAADLPVEQPSRFELVLNLHAARALSLSLPASLLQRADAVFR
jgi:putative ABC transport system substrate-binding protein